MTAAVVAWLESPPGERWSRNYHRPAGATQFMYGTDDGGGWVFTIAQVHSGWTPPEQGLLTDSSATFFEARDQAGTEAAP